MYLLKEFFLTYFKDITIAQGNEYTLGAFILLHSIRMTGSKVPFVLLMVGRSKIAPHVNTHPTSLICS